jgi:hypothetical protein
MAITDGMAITESIEAKADIKVEIKIEKLI